MPVSAGSKPWIKVRTAVVIGDNGVCLSVGRCSAIWDASSAQSQPNAATGTNSHQSRPHSIPEYPPRNPRIPLIAAVLGKRLVAPECVRRGPVRQLEQQ